MVCEPRYHLQWLLLLQGNVSSMVKFQSFVQTVEQKVIVGDAYIRNHCKHDSS
jgi:hypothetical protein